MHRAYLYANWRQEDGTYQWEYRWCYVAIVNQFMFISMED